MNEIPGADGGWREKYLALIDQVEARERGWKERERLLRLGISRLSLMAEAPDVILEQVEALRGLVRADELDTVQLRLRLESLGEALREMEDRPSKPRRRRSESAEVLEALVERLEVPRGLRRKARAVEKTLEHSGLDAPPASLITPVAGLIGELIDWAREEGEPASEPKSPGGSLFDRWFGGGGGSSVAPEPASAPPPQAAPDADPPPSPRPQAPAPSVSEAAAAPSMPGTAVPPPGERASEPSSTTAPVSPPPAAAPEPPTDTATPTGTAGSAPEPAPDAVVADSAIPGAGPTVAPTVPDTLPGAPPTEGPVDAGPPGAVVPPPGPSARMTLLALLERLALPEVLSERLEQTRTDLVAAPADDALDANVAQIAELINEGRRLSLAEKHAVEGFLKELTDRLQDLDRGLTATGASREQAQQRRRDFDEHLRDQVRTIGSSVEGALDLDALKAQVAERVDAIELHMTEFRRHDTEREREAEEEIRALTERLQSLERETGGLRARLQHERAQALLDPLTQVPNRLAYEERLAAEYLRFKRYRRPLVLAVVDIDLFKRINDGYGHKAGDRVLQIVARLLAEGLRETDFVGRYGGEEFALLMPETRAQDAVAVLDKLRLQIAEAETHFHGTPVRVSVSCGVAEIAPEDSEASLFERADRALYRAKQGGRNRCELG